MRAAGSRRSGYPTPTLAGETKDPSFLAFHPNKKFLYAVNEGQASVSAFAIDAKTGELTFLNSQPSGGGAPCHLLVDPTGSIPTLRNFAKEIMPAFAAASPAPATVTP